MILPCKSILPHYPCTQLVLWLKLGFLSGEVWDSALNLFQIRKLMLRKSSCPLYACASALEGGTKVCCFSIPSIINKKNPNQPKHPLLTIFNTAFSR